MQEFTTLKVGKLIYVVSVREDEDDARLVRITTTKASGDDDYNAAVIAGDIEMETRVDIIPKRRYRFMYDSVELCAIQQAALLEKSLHTKGGK